MTEHKDRNLIGYSDSAKYRKKYDTVFGKKFKWIKIEKKGDKFEASTCPIAGHIDLPYGESLDMLCKESVHGKCAYCGDVETRNDTERKIQCFYPVIQKEGAWHPEKSPEQNKEI